MNRIATILAFFLSTGCDNLSPDPGTSSTSTTSTDSCDGHSSTSGEGSGEHAGSTTDETSSGGEGGSDSGTGDEPAFCAPLVDDPLTSVCEVCTPVWDANGQVIGRDCCWAAQDTDTCLSPCDEGCDEGFVCHAVAVAAKLDVCWPE